MAIAGLVLWWPAKNLYGQDRRVGAADQLRPPQRVRPLRIRCVPLHRVDRHDDLVRALDRSAVHASQYDDGAGARERVDAGCGCSADERSRAGGAAHSALPGAFLKGLTIPTGGKNIVVAMMSTGRPHARRPQPRGTRSVFRAGVDDHQYADGTRGNEPINSSVPPDRRHFSCDDPRALFPDVPDAGRQVVTGWLIWLKRPFPAARAGGRNKV